MMRIYIYADFTEEVRYHGCGHTSLIDTIYLRAEESPIDDDDAMPSHIPICTSLLTADVVVVVVSHVFGTMQQQHKY